MIFLDPFDTQTCPLILLVPRGGGYPNNTVVHWKTAPVMLDAKYASVSSKDPNWIQSTWFEEKTGECVDCAHYVKVDMVFTRMHNSFWIQVCTCATTIHTRASVGLIKLYVL